MINKRNLIQTLDRLQAFVESCTDWKKLYEWKKARS